MLLYGAEAWTLLSTDVVAFRAFENCSTIATKIDVNLEIKRRITLVSRCYYGLDKQLSNRNEKTNTLQDAHPIRAFLWRMVWTLLTC